jgi:hypothetical protein
LKVELGCWFRGGTKWLTASSDYSQAVVLKVSKSIGAPLDELHFPVEAFRNAIVFGEPPHGGDFCINGERRALSAARADTARAHCEVELKTIPANFMFCTLGVPLDDRTLLRLWNQA